MKSTQILSKMRKLTFQIATEKDAGKRMELWEQHSNLESELIIEICKLDKVPEITEKELPECLRK